MSKLGQEIPSQSDLETKLNKVFDEDDDFIASTEPIRKKVVDSQKKTLPLLIGFIISVVVIFPLFIHFYLVGKIMATLYLVALGVVVIKYIIEWSKAAQKLTDEINKALLPIISKTLGRECVYTDDKGNADATKALLNQSELLTERIDSIETDGSYRFTEPCSLTVRELKAERIERRDKNTTTVTVFSGVFVEVDLVKELSGVTYISTEGDKSGFGHLNFFGKILGLGNIKETKLEWNQFEKDLHVATSDPSEARYVLTPNFMSDLHDWWVEDKENIRIVFRGNKMFMLLPDKEIKFGMSTASDKPEKVKEYALSVIRPLWRTITLVEDIRL